MFLDDKKIPKAVENLIKSERNLNIAVAFIGKKSEELLLTHQGDIKIICNLESGSTNPFSIEKLLKLENIKIKTNKRLHAKLYSGTNQAVIGSANLSANGLANEGNEMNGWIEAGYLIEKSIEVKKTQDWFSKLWRISSKIDKKKLKEVRPISNLNKTKSLLYSIEEHPEDLLDRNIYIVMYSDDELSDQGKKADKKVKTKYKGEYDVYESWPDLPEDSYLLNYYIDNSLKKHKFENVTKSPEKRILEYFEEAKSDEDSLFVMFPSKNIGEFKFTKKDQNFILKKINLLFNSEFSKGDEESRYIKLSDAIDILNTNSYRDRDGHR